MCEQADNYFEGCVKVGTVHIKHRTYPLFKDRKGRTFYVIHNKDGTLGRQGFFLEMAEQASNVIKDY